MIIQKIKLLISCIALLVAVLYIIIKPVVHLYTCTMYCHILREKNMQYHFYHLLHGDIFSVLTTKSVLADEVTKGTLGVSIVEAAVEYPVSGLNHVWAMDTCGGSLS